MKKNIIITNTGTVITPYEKGQCDKLERWTSVYNNALFKYDPVIGFVVLDNENVGQVLFYPEVQDIHQLLLL